MVENKNIREVRKGDDPIKITNTAISMFCFDKHSRGFTLWYNRKFNGRIWMHTKSVSFGNYYGIWKKNNTIAFSTNGAQKDNPKDTCLDCTLTLGKLNFGYTNWSY
jgi:hypothetical protein